MADQKRITLSNSVAINVGWRPTGIQYGRGAGDALQRAGVAVRRTGEASAAALEETGRALVSGGEQLFQEASQDAETLARLAGIEAGQADALDRAEVRHMFTANGKSYSHIDENGVVSPEGSMATLNIFDRNYLQVMRNKAVLEMQRNAREFFAENFSSMRFKPREWGNFTDSYIESVKTNTPEHLHAHIDEQIGNVATNFLEKSIELKSQKDLMSAKAVRAKAFHDASEELVRLFTGLNSNPSDDGVSYTVLNAETGKQEQRILVNADVESAIRRIALTIDGDISAGGDPEEARAKVVNLRANLAYSYLKGRVDRINSSPGTLSERKVLLEDFLKQVSLASFKIPLPDLDENVQLVLDFKSASDVFGKDVKTIVTNLRGHHSNLTQLERARTALMESEHYKALNKDLVNRINTLYPDNQIDARNLPPEARWTLLKKILEMKNLEENATNKLDQRLVNNTIVEDVLTMLQAFSKVSDDGTPNEQASQFLKMVEAELPFKLENISDLLQQDASGNYSKSDAQTATKIFNAIQTVQKALLTSGKKMSAMLTATSVKIKHQDSIDQAYALFETAASSNGNPVPTGALAVKTFYSPDIGGLKTVTAGLPSKFKANLKSAVAMMREGPPDDETKDFILTLVNSLKDHASGHGTLTSSLTIEDPTIRKAWLHMYEQIRLNPESIHDSDLHGEMVRILNNEKITSLTPAREGQVDDYVLDKLKKMTDFPGLFNGDTHVTEAIVSDAVDRVRMDLRTSPGAFETDRAGNVELTDKGKVIVDRGLSSFVETYHVGGSRYGVSGRGNATYIESDPVIATRWAIEKYTGMDSDTIFEIVQSRLRVLMESYKDEGNSAYKNLVFGKNVFLHPVTSASGERLLGWRVMLKDSSGGMSLLPLPERPSEETPGQKVGWLLNLDQETIHHKERAYLSSLPEVIHFRKKLDHYADTYDYIIEKRPEDAQGWLTMLRKQYIEGQGELYQVTRLFSGQWPDGEAGWNMIVNKISRGKEGDEDTAMESYKRFGDRLSLEQLEYVRSLRGPVERGRSLFTGIPIVSEEQQINLIKSLLSTERDGSGQAYPFERQSMFPSIETSGGLGPFAGEYIRLSGEAISDEYAGSGLGLYGRP